MHVFKKKERIALIILVPLLIVLVVAIGLIARYRATLPVEYTYPDSGLSNSIFVQQNQIYTPNENFKKQYRLNTIPYLIDVPGSTSAVVGNGYIEQISNKMLLYITECTSDQLQSALTDELSNVLYSNQAVKEKTTFQVEVNEKGYLNGYETAYAVLKMHVVREDGNSKDAYIVGYLVNPDNNGRCVFVSTIVTSVSNQTLASMQQICATEIGLLRLNQEEAETEIETQTQTEGVDEKE